MTVRLAKFFVSSNNNAANVNANTNAGNNLSMVPPPLPPPNPAMKQKKYYEQQQPAPPSQIQQQHATHPYNLYTMHNDASAVAANAAAVYDLYNINDDDDVDDDSVSMYSANTNMMMQRDHSCNNSQRPLLGERKPIPIIQNVNGTQNKLLSLANKKKLNGKQQQQQHIMTVQPLHLNTIGGDTDMDNERRTYISPYVQQQKRDSAKGLHGFNDFDALSQQYNQHLTQSPHIGYPYGSPPSPTANSNDFVFDSFTAPKSAASYSSTASASSTSTSAGGRGGGYSAITSTPRYGNVTTNNTTNYNNHYDDAFYQTKKNQIQQQLQQHQQQHTQHIQHYMGKASRFEDDFCCRRNVDFTTASQTANQAQNLNAIGPFVFGMPHEQQNDDIVGRYGYAYNNDNQYQQNQQQQEQEQQQQQQQEEQQRLYVETTHQNAQSSVINTNITEQNSNGITLQNAGQLKEQSTLQQSSDTSCDSGRGVKILLRKRKSKKTTAVATTATIPSGTAKKDKKKLEKTKSEQQQQQQQNNKNNNNNNKKKPTIKCVLVGDGAVGKTNLILSYLENRFNPEHVPTASDIYNAEVTVNDSPVHLTLCDTAGQDTLDPLRELCYPDSDVFLLCFSVIKPETFHAIKTKWAPKFTKTKAALILVGTQADLRSNMNVLKKLQTNGEKPISYADAWDLATTIGAKYIETSSATKDKVKEVFDTAIWEGLVPTTLPPTPSFWRKLFCLA